MEIVLLLLLLIALSFYISIRNDIPLCYLLGVLVVLAVLVAFFWRYIPYLTWWGVPLESNISSPKIKVI